MAETFDGGASSSAASALALAPAELVIEVNGDMSVLRLETGGCRVGRAVTNQLSYPNMTGLSREHLAIEREDGQWIARDLGSTNGSLINGEALAEPRVLRSGDRITAGQLTLVYRDVYREATEPADGAVQFTDEPPSSSGAITISEGLERLIAQESAEGSRHMQALITAGRELATHLPLGKLFDLILELSVEAAGAARGVLMTLENGELHVRSAKGQGLRISSHVRDLVIQEKRSLLVRDAMSDAALAAHASIAMSRIRSMMAVPLQAEDRVIGLIYLDSSHLVKEFTKQDLSLLTVMANMAAVRIENARLAEVEQAERMRARELEHAAMIQRSMLPSQFPPFPDRTDFELHAAMAAAKEVGGDLFDFFLLDADRLGFAVGNVSGKGVPAALYMAIARTLLRAAAHHRLAGRVPFLHEPVPGGAARLRHVRHSVLRDSQHAHGCAGIFKRRPQSALRVFSRRENARAEGAVRPHAGRLRGLSISHANRQSSPREGLLVYTDGVTEARNHRGEFYEDRAWRLSGRACLAAGGRYGARPARRCGAFRGRSSARRRHDRARAAASRLMLTRGLWRAQRAPRRGGDSRFLRSASWQLRSGVSLRWAFLARATRELARGGNR